ncbi:hypothetical protein, partial [Lysobacter sp. D1-1-M9]|uniref:hypothetical protein n=2 Tax=Novilysobacter TaxID=3382699 RepID=UPI003982F963
DSDCTPALGSNHRCNSSCRRDKTSVSIKTDEVPTASRFGLIQALGAHFGAVVAQPYLNDLEALVAGELSGFSGLVCKHFFGGAALYSNMKVCASLTPAGFAFKLSKHRCSYLIESGKASPLRYFENSPVKKGYVLSPDASNLSKAAVVSYLKECMAHATSPGA